MSAPPARLHRKRPLRAVFALLVTALLAGVAIVGTPGAAHAAPPSPATVSGGSADWGVFADFRNYVTGTIANGSITVDSPATTNGDGTFHFPNATGTYNAGTASAAYAGSVHFLGHGGALDMTVSDVRVEITSATAGVLRADVVSRSLSTGAFVSYPDVAFATLNLTGITPTESGSTSTWTNIPATLTADGSAAFASFYPAGKVLDPVTTSLQLAPVWTPQITVSKTAGIDLAGETVTVSGSGFNPNANISTRPPVPVGMPTGIYVVFGRFADTWQPSQGAPSTARRVIDQKWPLPAASKAAAELPPFGPNAQYVVLQADGSFTTTLNITQNDTFTGNYGIATYAAGGAAANASQETFTPMSFVVPTGTDAATQVPDFKVTGNKDVSKFSVEVTNVDTAEFTVSPADIAVTVKVNGAPVSDAVTPSSPNAKKLKAGKIGKFGYSWAHGASLQAGDVVSITACTTVANDDGPNNNCDTTVSPGGSVDVANTTALSSITTKKTSLNFKTSLTNTGSAPVLLRPDDVSYSVFVNDQPNGGTVVSKTELGKRKLLPPTKIANYTFTWNVGAVAVGDVVEVVTCVSALGDVTSGDNCSTATFVVVK